MTTTQTTITLSLADARKLAAGELREVLVRMKRTHQRDVAALSFREMPYQPGDVLAVKEPWTLYAVMTDLKRPITHHAYVTYSDETDGSPVISKEERDRLGEHIRRYTRARTQAAATMPLWAVRHWLRVTACEPVEVDGKWWWRVGVEKMEGP